MRNPGVKGFISALIAAAAIIVLVFALSTAINSQEKTNSLLKMQAARETALQAENVIRLLDKATGDGLCRTPAEANYYFDTVLSNFKNGINCSTENISTIGTSISGDLVCESSLNNSKINFKKTFNFSKNVSTDLSGNCVATD